MRDYYDIEDLNDNLNFYTDLMDLREFEVIFKDEKLIEKELLLFLSKDLPEFIPFFNYIPWESIEPHLDEINNCTKIDLEKLGVGVTPKAQKKINSISLKDLSKPKSNINQIIIQIKIIIVVLLMIIVSIMKI